jgi:hypothetical protein
MIVPVDPLPAEWTDGKELWIDAANGPPTDLDQWQRELEALCATSDPAEEERLQGILDQIRAQGKAAMRQQAGLPG